GRDRYMCPFKHRRRPPAAASRRSAASSVAPVASDYELSLRPCRACLSLAGGSAAALEVTLGGEVESVSLGQALDVALVEELDVHVRVLLAQLAELAVLPRHERLLHHCHLEEQVLLGQEEVRGERFGDAPLLVALEHERPRLVVPGHVVVV